MNTIAVINCNLEIRGRIIRLDVETVVLVHLTLGLRLSQYNFMIYFSFLFHLLKFGNIKGAKINFFKKFYLFELK